MSSPATTATPAPKPITFADWFQWTVCALALSFAIGSILTSGGAA